MLWWILHRFKSKSNKSAFKAATALASMESPPISQVISALRDDPGLRERAVYFLQLTRKQHTDLVVQQLIPALGDSLEQVRVTAAEVLADLPDVRATDALHAALKDDCDVVRVYAAGGLAKLGQKDERIIAELVKAYHHVDRRLRTLVELMLIKEIGKAALPQLLLAKKTQQIYGLYDVLIAKIDPAAVPDLHHIRISPYPEAHPGKGLTREEASHLASNWLRLAQAFVSARHPGIMISLSIDENLRSAKLSTSGGIDTRHLTALNETIDFLVWMESDGQLTSPLSDSLVCEFVVKRLRWLSQ